MSQPKASLRTHFRQLRRELGPQQQHHAAEQLASLITSAGFWSSAQHIALYLANDGEVATTAIVERARNDNKTLYLPSVKPDRTLDFSLWNNSTQLIQNRYGIAEPPPTQLSTEVAQLDLLLMPVVAWNRQGGRLGMGGGYYDKTLGAISSLPLLIGVAYSFQESDNLELDPWDVRLNFVACEQGIYQCEQ